MTLRRFRARRARIHLKTGETFEGIWVATRAGQHVFEGASMLHADGEKPLRFSGRCFFEVEQTLVVQELWA